MSSFRRAKRAQHSKEKKKIKRQLGELDQVLSNTQKACKLCNESFDNKNPSRLDGWHVHVYDDRAELFCEKCYTQIEFQENLNESGTKAETV